MNARLLAATFLCLPVVAGAGPDRAVIEIVQPPIDGFYGKRLLDGKIPILSHASVSDEALLAARERLERLLGHAPKLRKNLESARYELHVSGLRQYTSDLPEFRSERGARLENGELFDRHMIGGHLAGRTSSCSEGTLLPIVGHHLYGDDTCVHELAHAIEWIALDAPNRERISEHYRRSLGSGHWRDQYAAKNSHEWFAEITKLYFRSTVGAEFYDPTLSRGRQWLCQYDPDACAWIGDLYSGKTDPGSFAVVDLALRPGRDEKKLRSERSERPTRLWVRNLSPLPVRITWIEFDGARDQRASFVDRPALAPGAERTVFTFARHAWVVTDAEGRALCTFVSPDSDASVEIRSRCD
jgi:hypothetical protein